MNTFSTNRRVRIAACAIAGVATLGLAACSPSGDKDAAQPATSASSSAPAEHSDHEHMHGDHEHSHGDMPATMGDEVIGKGDVTLKGGYVKAMPADKHMTAIFGELHNMSDKDITITSLSGSIEGAKFEIHEVKDGKMMMKKDGLKVPAMSTVTLKPGAEHFMIMGVNGELAAGDTVDLTVKDSESNSYDLPAIPVRVQHSGEENYGG